MFQGFAAAGLGALANLGGGFMSAQGAASANAANLAQSNMINQQMLNMEMAKHEQNTAFQEDAQAHQLMSQHIAQDYSSREADRAREWSAGEAQKQMNFQAEMANTAYQRAMRDMKAAGLNPILAYQRGGAPAPAGAMGSAGTPSSSGGSAGMASSTGSANLKAANILNDKDALGRAFGNLVNSAIDAARNYEGIDNIKSDTTLKQQQGQNEGQKIEKTIQETYTEKERNKVLQEQQKLLRAETVRAGANTAKALADAGLTSEQTKSMREHGSREAPNTIERLLRALQSWFTETGPSMPAPPAWDNSPMLWGKDNR